MTLEQEVEIIYRYIVQNYTMKEVGAQLGWEEWEISDTVRGYGFNEDHATRKGPGKDKGRYAPGKPSCHGVRVDRNLIADYLQCADEYNWKFEHYIADVAQNMAESRKQQQLREQQQRQMAQQREQERRQAEQNARIERERRQREAQEQQRRQVEQQRLQAEQERLRKAQEQKNISEYRRLVDIGRKALVDRQLQKALDSFYDARRYFDGVELCILIAEVLATCSTPEQHYKTIMTEIRDYENYLYKKGKHLAPQHNLWLARAYFEDGQKSNAIYRYSVSASKYYDEKNYKMADAIYKESYEKTGTYTNGTNDGYFKMAFARSEIENIGKDDHLFCIDAYDECIRNNGSIGIALGNQGWHYNQLGEYKKAIDVCERAIIFANKNPYVFHNLFEAYTSLKQYGDAYKVLERMEREKIEYGPWKKAECIYQGMLFGENSYEEAERLYKKQLAQGEHLFSYCRLLYVCQDDVQAVIYGLKYADKIKNTCGVTNEFAAKLLERAEKTGSVYQIDRALEYNPEQKRKRQQEKLEQQRIQREKQLAEQKRIEDEKRIAEAKRQKEEQQRRLEQEKRQREEQERRIAEEKRRLEELARQKRLKEEQELLLMLF